MIALKSFAFLYQEKSFSSSIPVDDLTLQFCLHMCGLQLWAPTFPYCEHSCHSPLKQSDLSFFQTSVSKFSVQLAANFGDLLNKKLFSCFQEISQREKHTTMVVSKKGILRVFRGLGFGLFWFFI